MVVNLPVRCPIRDVDIQLASRQPPEYLITIHLQLLTLQKAVMLTLRNHYYHPATGRNFPDDPRKEDLLYSLTATTSQWVIPFLRPCHNHPQVRLPYLRCCLQMRFQSGMPMVVHCLGDRPLVDCHLHTENSGMMNYRLFKVGTWPGCVFYCGTCSG